MIEAFVLNGAVFQRKKQIVIVEIVMQQNLEFACLMLLILELDHVASLSKGITNVHLGEDVVVEVFGEGDCCLVEDLLRLLDTDHVLCLNLLEDSADEVRFASSDEDQIQVRHGLADQLIEHLLADEFSLTDVVFEQEEVALSLSIVVIGAHGFF